MANETPHHQYREIGDDPKKDGEDYGCKLILSGCHIIMSLPVIILTIISFVCGWDIMRWVWMSISIILLLVALFCRFVLGYDKSSPRLKKAERAKEFLGFDFGDEFTLRTTGSHDYDEILLDFSSEAFSSLHTFCSHLTTSENQRDSYTKNTVTEILDYVVVKDDSSMRKEKITKPGLTKIESRYDSNGSITSQLRLEVDYEYRTLKMSLTGW